MFKRVVRSRIKCNSNFFLFEKYNMAYRCNADNFAIKLESFSNLSQFYQHGWIEGLASIHRLVFIPFEMNNNKTLFVKSFAREKGNESNTRSSS